MNSLSLDVMRQFLSKSISSGRKKKNETEEERRERAKKIVMNKVYGINAEVAFRQHLSDNHFQDRVSPGGWIARAGVDQHGKQGPVVALFPETIQPRTEYPEGRVIGPPPIRLHMICATFHQIGVRSYYCTPVVKAQDDTNAVEWKETAQWQQRKGGTAMTGGSSATIPIPKSAFKKLDKAALDSL